MVLKDASMKLVVNYKKMSKELMDDYGVPMAVHSLRMHVEHGVPIKKDVNKIVDTVFRKYLIEAYISLKHVLDAGGDLEAADSEYNDKTTANRGVV
jgi:hypothetical protein